MNRVRQGWIENAFVTAETEVLGLLSEHFQGQVPREADALIAGASAAAIDAIQGIEALSKLWGVRGDRRKAHGIIRVLALHGISTWLTSSEGLAEPGDGAELRVEWARHILDIFGMNTPLNLDQFRLRDLQTQFEAAGRGDSAISMHLLLSDMLRALGDTTRGPLVQAPEIPLQRLDQLVISESFAKRVTPDDITTVRQVSAQTRAICRDTYFQSTAPLTNLLGGIDEQTEENEAEPGSEEPTDETAAEAPLPSTEEEGVSAATASTAAESETVALPEAAAEETPSSVGQSETPSAEAPAAPAVEAPAARRIAVFGPLVPPVPAAEESASSDEDESEGADSPEVAEALQPEPELDSVPQALDEEALRAEEPEGAPAEAPESDTVVAGEDDGIPTAEEPEQVDSAALDDEPLNHTFVFAEDGVGIVSVFDEAGMQWIELGLARGSVEAPAAMPLRLAVNLSLKTAIEALDDDLREGLDESGLASSARTALVPLEYQYLRPLACPFCGQTDGLSQLQQELLDEDYHPDPDGWPYGSPAGDRFTLGCPDCDFLFEVVFWFWE